MSYRVVDLITRIPISGDVAKEEAERIAKLYNREMQDNLAADIINLHPQENQHERKQESGIGMGWHYL